MTQNGSTFMCFSYSEKEVIMDGKPSFAQQGQQKLKLQGPLPTYSAYVQGSGRGSRNMFTWP